MDSTFKEPRNGFAIILQKILNPIRKFMALETASGILLIAVTLIAILWANSDFKESYESLLQTTISFSIGSLLHLEHSLLHWINDGLMVIFFFVVGLEIKKELVIGQLSSVKKASLPILAAIGGMIVPALIYFSFNQEGVGRPGWGIPMATDIAFAVGVLTLLGKQVPFALRIFLLALAIVDDLGAILVIAIFYTEQISFTALGFAASLIAFCLLLNKAGVRNLFIYIISGIFIWLAFMKSGVHATVAGVILGFITPIRAWLTKEDVVTHISSLTQKISVGLKDILHTDHKTPLPPETVHSMTHLQIATKEAIAPLDRIVHNLHPWVMFIIMPVFALANAGVYLGNIDLATVTTSPITMGTFLGLFVGKPLGIFTTCFIGVKAKLAVLPQGVSWLQVFGVSVLAGIGFTMALFISHLALKTPEIEAYSKIGILSASLCAAIVGFSILKFSRSR